MLKNKRGIGCGLVVLALIAGAFLLFGNLGGGGNQIPQTGPGSTGGQDGGQLGRPYVAREVDRSGCPVDSTAEFFSDEVIYAGYGQSDIPRGSELFARLIYEGDPVEDTPPITAEENIRSCVWFQFSPQGDGFLPGQYEVDLYVNGNLADQLPFEVQEDSAASSGSGEVELGRVTTASQVDNDGCPVDRQADFFPDEPVYLATQPSFIPAGTEVFGRLVYEGDIVEDTDPIVADRDLETCIWFVFEPTGSQGFLPGRYNAELYINGSLAEQVPFEVQ